jgi:hypothetical protein
LDPEVVQRRGHRVRLCGRRKRTSAASDSGRNGRQSLGLPAVCLQAFRPSFLRVYALLHLPDHLRGPHFPARARAQLAND